MSEGPCTIKVTALPVRAAVYLDGQINNAQLPTPFYWVVTLKYVPYLTLVAVHLFYLVWSSWLLFGNLVSEECRKLLAVQL